MNELYTKVEEITEREVDNDSRKKEISELSRMLNIGFETRTDGYTKVPKLMSTSDAKKIQKFYDSFANQIKAMKVTGDLDKFLEYVELNHSIKISVKDDFPNIQFSKNEKKKQKFYDMYSTYFVEEIPKNAKEALDKITKAMFALFKDHKQEEEPIKEDLKNLIESGEYSSTTVKTLNKIIKKSLLKEEKVTNIADEIEQNLNEQLKAVEIAGE